MRKNRLILILGVLTLITPILGIPNSVQDWLIAIYGLILIFIVLFEYFSDEDKVDAGGRGCLKDHVEKGVSEPTFEENGFEEKLEEKVEDTKDVSTEESAEEVEETEVEKEKELSDDTQSEDDRI